MVIEMAKWMQQENDDFNGKREKKLINFVVSFRFLVPNLSKKKKNFLSTNMFYT